MEGGKKCSGHPTGSEHLVNLISEIDGGAAAETAPAVARAGTAATAEAAAIAIGKEASIRVPVGGKEENQKKEIIGK